MEHSLRDIYISAKRKKNKLNESCNEENIWYSRGYDVDI